MRALPTSMHRLESVHALFRATSLIVCAALALIGSGCATDSAASPKQAAAGEPIRIRYLAYASNQRLELVNPAHTDATELYSSTRPLADAGRKVSTAEVMDETLSYFKKRGFYDQADPGPAPTTAEGVWSQSLEVETQGRTVHMSVHRGTVEAERRLFLECAQAFVTIYNNTYQLQSVDQAPDWSPKRSQPPSGTPRTNSESGDRAP